MLIFVCYHFQKVSFQFEFFSVSRKVNKVSYRATGFVLFIKTSMTPFESRSFTSISWQVCSRLVILDGIEDKNDANVPLSFFSSKSLSFKFNSALFFFLEFAVVIFDISWELSLLVLVLGSKFYSYTHESFVFLLHLVILMLSLGFVTRLTRLNFLKILGFLFEYIFRLIENPSILKFKERMCFCFHCEYIIFLDLYF